MFLADAHCDTLTKALGAGEGLYDFGGHLNFRRLTGAFDGCLQFMAIYYKARPGGMSGLAHDALDFFDNQARKNGHTVRRILCRDDLEADLRGRVGVLLSLEGGELLDGSLENLRAFYERGVRSVCLTWSVRNELGDGTSVEEPHGLTDFGKEVVREMNTKRMIVDVSHASPPTFWDAVELSAAPVIASHSNAYGIYPHRRNLTDAQLRAIGGMKGFVGFNMYPEFIAGGEAGEDMMIRHIGRMLDMAGEDCVGLGCDFDGIERTPDGYGSVSELPKLYRRVEKEFGTDVAAKVFWGNLVRVVKEILG
ncbi:MAG: dipeptidase [Defluviitaleaceae bacterium]|nr:dipeptidase [Defluviitaleaceae bacterium]